MHDFRVSVSTLESFCRFINETSSFDTEERLIDKLRGVFDRTPKMMVGTCFHKIIEDPESIRYPGGYYHDETFLTFDQARPAYEYRLIHPGIHQELSVNKSFPLRSGSITVTGRVDSLEGIVIRDAKTKYRDPNFQEYHDSCQWKFYLEMLELDSFAYDVFQAKGLPTDMDQHYQEAMVFRDGKFKGQRIMKFEKIYFVPFEPFICHRYPSMVRELNTIVQDFMDWVTYRNLTQYLKQAQSDPIPF